MGCQLSSLVFRCHGRSYPVDLTRKSKDCQPEQVSIMQEHVVTALLCNLLSELLLHLEL
jgi:hypothetical protein